MSGFIIGRFQPLHHGHCNLIARALGQLGDDPLTIIIGSTGCAPDFVNPFLPEQVQEMIKLAFSEHLDRIKFAVVEDNPYDDAAWVKALRSAAQVKPGDKLFGFKKDASSFYLDLFPDLEFWSIEPPSYAKGMSATAVRELLFNQNRLFRECAPFVPDVVVSYFKKLFSENAKQVESVFSDARRYFLHQEEWDCPGARKYELQHNAVDAIVLSPYGEILLIERSDNGALALPGGFIDKGERIISAVLRELKEETGVEIKLDTQPDPLSFMTFDHPRRDSRARVFTHVGVFKLSERQEPVAQSDAKTARWVPISELPKLKPRFYADHFHIINFMLKRRAAQ